MIVLEKGNYFVFNIAQFSRLQSLRIQKLTVDISLSRAYILSARLITPETVNIFEAGPKKREAVRYWGSLLRLVFLQRVVSSKFGMFW